ncbi:MAG: preprotein translocase subunit SecE [Anaerolineaceae bacterium]|jgi:preprotein translocase subunit SecE|nr:preprotein translocase subunit SecE [Anaerolineaceae bacterium]HNX45317.1 preprotein translocase subunit SecE [Anaerolineaceae bacterium]HPT23440.1 preprotein translocase subunit SecE [Anaerolineaceae bacterium]
MAQNEKKPNIFQKTKHWWRETIGELRKVTWPTTQEALALTRIVLIVTVIMSVLLGLMDFVFSRLVGLLVS